MIKRKFVFITMFCVHCLRHVKTISKIHTRWLCTKGYIKPYMFIVYIIIIMLVKSTVRVCVSLPSPGVHATYLNKYCLRVFKEHRFCSDARITDTKELIVVIDKQMRHNMENVQWIPKGLKPVNSRVRNLDGQLLQLNGAEQRTASKTLTTHV